MYLWLPFCSLHSSCVQYICLHLQICTVHRCKVFQSRNLKKSELHSVLFCRIGFYKFLYYLQGELSLLIWWIFYLGLLYLFLTNHNTLILWYLLYLTMCIGKMLGFLCSCFGYQRSWKMLVLSISCILLHGRVQSSQSLVFLIKAYWQQIICSQLYKFLLLKFVYTTVYLLLILEQVAI